MGLISVPVDPAPARAKIDLQLHQRYRTRLGLGRLRCEGCGETGNRHSCTARESAARLFLYTATRTRIAAALDSGRLTTDDLRLRRTAPARHRRRPRPHPRRVPSTNPLAALGIPELAGALR
ncbi:MULTISPECIES: hypothetical protein [Glycomyces]|uniref:Uncharacterized protein n=2 Tax=Glycomyces TaxID=58113 RepID=A0A9X3PNZ2_9ACTN|nr:hypothetical protein [Glycomyces lechevalierae]MDA1387168.1 hypothetical protein [Glycomyces lechevalierae]MDR7338568.1 hypothetical protein [Glycomyces lechevalierae]